MNKYLELDFLMIQYLIEKIINENRSEKPLPVGVFPYELSLTSIFQPVGKINLQEGTLITLFKHLETLNPHLFVSRIDIFVKNWVVYLLG